MASGFPGSIDSFTNPLTTSALNSPSHAGQHQDLNDAVNKIETYMGLVKVDSTTFSATTTPFINGCFSSLYRNYRVNIVWTGSANTDCRLRLRSGTSTPETGAVYDRFGYYQAGAAFTFANTANNTNAIIADHSSNGNAIANASIDIFYPNVTSYTNIQMQTWGGNSGYIYTWLHRVETTTQYTGIEMTADTGTVTGTITVYGYRN